MNYISDDSKDYSLLTIASSGAFVPSPFNTGLRFTEILKTLLSLSDLVLKGDLDTVVRVTESSSSFSEAIYRFFSQDYSQL